MTHPTVGLIGTGKMGAPMAARIAGAGFPLVVCDRDAEQAQTVARESGAHCVTDARSLAATCSVVITMLPNGQAVHGAIVDSGLADSLPPGSTVIDMSSSDPVGTRALGALLADKGMRFLDAPVSGGVPRAENGTLAIMMGGDEETIEACRPLFSSMGTQLFHAGPLGAGHAIKALNNYVSAAGLVAAVEALRLGEAFGLDPARITEVLNASTGRNNATENKLAQHVIPESYGSGFSLGLMCKDLETALGLSAETGIPAPFAEGCVGYWRHALEVLGPNADHTAVVDKPSEKTA